MAKTIAISDDVYQLLTKAKLPGESFSDVIRRGMKRGVKLYEVWGSGTLTEEDWQKTKKLIKEAEAVTNRRIEKNLS